MRTLILLAAFLNFGSMKPESPIGAEICELIGRIDKVSAHYQSMFGIYHPYESETETYQFEARYPWTCFEKLIFVRRHDTDIVNHVDIMLDEKCTCDLNLLTTHFGKFEEGVPTPQGTWSAYAEIKGSTLSFTLIAQNRGPIEADTPLTQLVLRVD